MDLRPPQPFAELPGQQLSEKCAHTDTGVKIAVTPDRSFLPFIISVPGRIKRQLHEAGKSDGSALGDFLRNNLDNFIQFLALWARFGY